VRLLAGRATPARGLAPAASGEPHARYDHSGTHLPAKDIFITRGYEDNDRTMKCEGRARQKQTVKAQNSLSSSTKGRQNNLFELSKLTNENP